MIETSACMGCCLSPFFINTPTPIVFPDLPSNPLTESERDLLRRLGECYNLFTSLEKRSEADNSEFVDAIHRCQQIVALRVARRVDPEVWAQPE